MMVSALRSRVVACVLVLFTLMGTTGAWHVEGDDPDCAAVALHDHSAHHERLSAARPTQAPSHCAICHWLQGFRIDGVPSTVVASDDDANSPVLARNRHPRLFLVRVDVPSRAPPAQFS
jgi:hypothetical protein